MQNMNYQSSITMNYKSIIFNVISWLFGVAVFTVGLINTFWGNDPFFGLFLVMLSFVYFPPVAAMIKSKVGVSIPAVIKISLAVFIVMAAWVGIMLERKTVRIMPQCRTLMLL